MKKTIWIDIFETNYSMCLCSIVNESVFYIKMQMFLMCWEGKVKIERNLFEFCTESVFYWHIFAKKIEWTFATFDIWKWKIGTMHYLLESEKRKQTIWGKKS